ncbi:MAG: hypothetical protein V9G63_00525 [Candidatus Competibacter sp.]|nr:hypothetical protein [Candidatus Competibacteraceae bacterium]
MTPRSFTAIALAVALLSAAIGNAQPSAPGSHGRGHDEPVAIPATGAAILAAADQRVAAIDRAIADGKLAGVHAEAFAARDLLVALPQKVGGLGEAEAKALAAAIGRIRQQAALLDKFGDAGDVAQTRAVLARFKTEIAGIRQQVAGKPDR